MYLYVCVLLHPPQEELLHSMEPMVRRTAQKVYGRRLEDLTSAQVGALAGVVVRIGQCCQDWPVMSGSQRERVGGGNGWGGKGGIRLF